MKHATIVATGWAIGHFSLGCGCPEAMPGLDRIPDGVYAFWADTDETWESTDFFDAVTVVREGDTVTVTVTVDGSEAVGTYAVIRPETPWPAGAP